MIAESASNKDSRSLNEPRDVGRRKRIGHSPPTNIPAHRIYLSPPSVPSREVAAAFLGNVQGESRARMIMATKKPSLCPSGNLAADDGCSRGQAGKTMGSAGRKWARHWADRGSDRCHCRSVDAREDAE